MQESLVVNALDYRYVDCVMGRLKGAMLSAKAIPEDFNAYMLRRYEPLGDESDWQDHKPLKVEGLSITGIISSYLSNHYIWSYSTPFERFQERLSYFKKAKTNFSSCSENYLDPQMQLLRADYAIAANVVGGLREFDNEWAWSAQECCAFIVYQVTRLAKNLLTAHDNPYCLYWLPKLKDANAVAVLGKVPESADFVGLVYEGLGQLSVKAQALSEQEFAAQVEQLQQQLIQAYYHPQRADVNLADPDHLSVEALTEFLQYQALWTLLRDLTRLPKGTYVTPKVVPVHILKTGLADALMNSLDLGLSPSQQWQSDKQTLEQWLTVFLSYIRKVKYNEHGVQLRDDCIVALMHAQKKVLLIRYHPDKVPSKFAKEATAIFNQLEDFLGRVKRRLAEVYLPDTRMGYHQKIYPQYRSQAQAYFHYKVREAICTPEKKGQMRSLVQGVRQQPIATRQAMLDYLEGLDSILLKAISLIARSVHEKIAEDHARAQDRDFYANLHYLLHYCPVMERSLEEKGLSYCGNDSDPYRSMKDIAGTDIAVLALKLLLLYSNPETKAHERQTLSRLVSAIVNHQHGKAFLDVRYVKYAVQNMHALYGDEPMWQRVLGGLLILAAFAVMASLIVLAVAAFGAPTLVIAGFSVLLHQLALSTTLIGALSVTAAVVLGVPLLTCGIINARNRPFFRARQFRKIKAYECQLTLYSRYQYCETAEQARQVYDEYINTYIKPW